MAGDNGRRNIGRTSGLTEAMAMATKRTVWWTGLLAAAGVLATLGCHNTPVDTSQYALGPAPLRIPSPTAVEPCRYEDRLTGGEVFAMYCGGCHNARALAERPFSNYKNVAAHMRVRADLTGKEYAKLVAWMRRWHDVPPPNPPEETSPKRFFYAQPIAELRPEQPADAPTPQGSADGQAPAPR
jgi:hypothetical protein